MSKKAALPVLPTHPERPRLAALLNPGSLLATTALLAAVDTKIPPYPGGLMHHPRIAALLHAAAPAAVTVAVFAAPLAGVAVVAAPPQAQQLHVTAHGGQCQADMRFNSPGTMKYPDCLGD